MAVAKNTAQADAMDAGASDSGWYGLGDAGMPDEAFVPPSDIYGII